MQQLLADAVGRVDVARRLGQDRVDLHRAAAGAVAAHVLRDLVGEVLGADEVEHGALAGARRTARAARAASRRSSSVTPVTRPPSTSIEATARAGADRRAGGARAGGDRLGDRAHAAAHVAPGAAARRRARRARGAAGCRRCPGVRGPGPHADHAGRGVGALERVVLELVVEQVADRHRHDAGRVAAGRGGSCPRRGRPRAAARSTSPGRLEPSAGGGRSIIGRRKSRGLLEQRVEARHRVGVLARDARELLVGDLRRRCGSRIGVPVGGEGRERRVERDRVVAEARQLEVGDDLRAAASRRRRTRARRAGRATAPRSRTRRRGASRRSSTHTRRPARAR